MTDLHTRWHNLEGPPEDRHLALLLEGWNPQDIARVRAEIEGQDQPPMNKRQAEQ